MDHRDMDKEQAYQMAEYLIGSGIIDVGFRHSFIAFLAGAVSFGLAQWRAAVGDGAGAIHCFIWTPFLVGTAFWVAAAWKKLGHKAIWERYNWVEKHALNSAFDEMREWQRARDAKRNVEKAVRS